MSKVLISGLAGMHWDPVDGRKARRYPASVADRASQSIEDTIA